MMLITILIIIFIIAMIIVIRNGIRKRRAMKVSTIIDEAQKGGTFEVDRKGNIKGGSTGTTAGRKITDAVANALAKELVDDIWGNNVNTDNDLWDKFKDLGDSDFRAVVGYGTKYVREKGGYSWYQVGTSPTGFKQLVKTESCITGQGLISTFCSERDKSVSRMTGLGVE